MKRRKFIAAAAATTAAPFLARAQAGSGPAIDQIKQRGVMRAGLATFVPWAMRDKQGNLIGFELDVGNRLEVHARQIDRNLNDANPCRGLGH